MKKSKADKRQPTHHHLKPKCRGGNNTKENIIILRRSQHEGWHALFGESTLHEILVWLVTIAKKNDYHKVEPEIQKFY